MEMGVFGVWKKFFRTGHNDTLADMGALTFINAVQALLSPVGRPRVCASVWVRGPLESLNYALECS